MPNIKRYIDIGVNITDPMFKGIYNNSLKHTADLNNVLDRSWAVGLQKIIITGGNRSESESAVEYARSDENRLFATVGCHPTRCTEFERENPDIYIQDLKQLILNNKKNVVAVGECGLDYDRLHFCPKEIQKKYFELQLKLCTVLGMPLFLHCRNAAADLYDILQKYKLRGVIHSFDGTIQEATKFIDLGYYIGINGCSLKTESNLKVVEELPREWILLETDSPWCEIKRTHAGFKYVNEASIYRSVKKEKWTENAMVKGRNEPANIRQVLDIICAVKKDDEESLRELFYKNTIKFFF